MAGIDSVIVGALTKAVIPLGLSKASELNDKFEHFCNNKFIPYVVRSYIQLNKSTSQLFRNRNHIVSELYEPLTLSSHSSSQRAVINKYPSSLFDTHAKIIINDDAGMGKSTVLKMLYRYAVESSEIIPFYIDIKSLIKKDKIQTVQEYIVSTNPDFSDDISIKFLNDQFVNKKFLFLFDGADEVSDEIKSEVYDKIRLFTDNAKHCKFVVATRNEDKILSAFNDFISFNIEPLEIEQAYSLLRKYQFDDASADLLIDEIEKKENQAVKEFLTNPLLTSLLYTAYEHSKTIPLKKSSFFSQIYRSLYENHDATKIGYLTRPKSSGLDIDDFATVLSFLAFLGRKVEKLEYEEDELIEDLELIKQSHPTIDFNIRGFLTDIVSRVPLFRLEGLSYRWQHKSIQEFFFLNYILKSDDKEERNKAIRELSLSENSQKYKLILDILYDKNQILFHELLTSGVFRTIVNNCVTNATTSKDDTVSIFYKYFHGPAIDIVGGEYFDKATKGSETDPLGVDFDYLIQGIVENHNVEGFRVTRGNYTYGATPMFSALLHRPESVVLEILHSKKQPFIELVTREGRHDKEDKNTSSKEIPLRRKNLKVVNLDCDFYIPDYNGMKDFLDKFNNKATSQTRNKSFALTGF